MARSDPSGATWGPTVWPVTVADHLRNRLRSETSSLRRGHPPFAEAIVADARITSALRAEGGATSSRGARCRQILHLCWTSDAFLAQVLYRAKARMQDLGIPVLPRIAHRLAMSTAQVSIGDPVVVAPGLYLLHGQVVIDGLVDVGPGVVIGPWVTIGLKAGELTGPTIGPNARIGTGAKVIGPVTVGARAVVGANAVVVDDVPAGSTATGIPAHSVGSDPAHDASP